MLDEKDLVDAEFAEVARENPSVVSDARDMTVPGPVRTVTVEIAVVGDD